MSYLGDRHETVEWVRAWQAEPPCRQAKVFARTLREQSALFPEIRRLGGGPRGESVRTRVICLNIIRSALAKLVRRHPEVAHEEALAAIRAAREALVGTEPNGREDAFRTARARHVARLAALETVEAELAGILEGIVDGVLP